MDENEYNRIIKEINKEKKYIIKEGILFRIEDNEELRVIRKYEFEGLMYIAHDYEQAGHFGIKATYNRIKENYYWKGMLKDIEIYVKSCDSCQRRGKPIGKHELNIIKVIEPFYQIGIDIVRPLLVTERNNRYIVTAMDYFTKWPEAKTLEKADAKEVARFIYEDIICRHGCPKKILSDRGSHFNNKIIESLLKEFRIKHNFSTPYYPKTNGLIERFNKTLCESLAKVGNVEDWDLKIPGILLVYRTKKNDSTKIEPGYLIYRRKIKTLLNLEEKVMTIKERITRLIEELPNVRNKAKESIEKSQEN
ncbi:putative integrase core domain protein [Rhizophagus clarus]|uniref:Putative integrase core domain protein n=1 Tax=Rhizophagus clarus TaxID=94130 RepID=A0A8H3L536_9GLOM|nr:putative integrase core domain protein [Rhizophagus clarus]